MRHILYKAAMMAGAMMVAAPVPVLAAPAAAPVTGAAQDLACFMIFGRAASEATADGKDTDNATSLKLATFFFAGKAAGHYPGKNIMATVEANKAAVQAALTKQDPAACAKQVHDAMDSQSAPAAATPAPTPAPKPAP